MRSYSGISDKILHSRIAATAQLSLVESFTFEDFLSHLSYSESAMLESGISRIRARDLLKKMSKDAPLSRMKTQGTSCQKWVTVWNSDTFSWYLYIFSRRFIQMFRLPQRTRLRFPCTSVHRIVFAQDKCPSIQYRAIRLVDLHRRKLD